MKSCFFGWSDESSHNRGRFRAIGMISHPCEMKNEIEKYINNVIDGSVPDERELKWKDVNKFTFKAYKGIIDYFLREANKEQIRLDVLRWDIEDSRHSILGRDDNKNLQFMYYKLFRNVICRWGGGHWIFFPDENGFIDWEELTRYLKKLECKVPLKEELNIEPIKGVSSKDNVLIQVADLFTGMSIFSKKNFQDYQDYMEKKNARKKEEDEMSNFERRCEILNYFNKECKAKKKGVSLESKGGLETRNPKTTNINFWSYEPQVEEDKAPTR